MVFVYCTKMCRCVCERTGCSLQWFGALQHYLLLVRKDMNVNQYEMLFNIPTRVRKAPTLQIRGTPYLPLTINATSWYLHFLNVICCI